MTSPRATYRLQFHGEFTFADAAQLAPYLAELGISHVYASPWLKARPGSEHGYDIVDHNAFNPELGGAEGFEQLHAALQQHGMGQILDFVPNHMGVAQAGNKWWLDVLEWGRASPWADWFDIDWDPADPDLQGKVLLPFLGDHYGLALERGELEPRFDPETGRFSVWYFDNSFPLAPASWAQLLEAAAEQAEGEAKSELQRLAQHASEIQPEADNGDVDQTEASLARAQADALKADLASRTELHPHLHAGAAAFAVDPQDDAADIQPLHQLLEQQAWRLAYWRVAADEINYRRFFDINELAALRVENPEVFEHIHQLVGRLLTEGKLDGLRIDHIDGLFDPTQYCQRLRALHKEPFYLIVEKILALHENLRSDWPIDGTTGYEFLNQVTGLLIDGRSKTRLTATYRRFCDQRDDFDDIVYAAKLQIMRTTLSAELHVLANRLHRIARRNPRTRDYTLQGLTRALRHVVAAFPVYRTYVDARGATEEDRRDITWAIAQARKRSDLVGRDIFDFINRVLTLDLANEAGYGRAQVLRLAMKFQQYSSPVMAKGYEDTAMYRYHRLVALNEVGGDPRQFGISVAAFHAANERRAQNWPHAMLTTATHDSKRGADIRARIAVLSTLATDWRRAVRRWARLNRIWKLPPDGEAIPDQNDEYLLYQTLIGAWPVELMNGAWNQQVAKEFSQRVQDYMTKALREGKVRSSWSDPDTAYEDATQRFAARLIDRDTGRLFHDAFLPLQRQVAERGVNFSLVQLALKLTSPGVPDTYQGEELWDLNLVDPDNRRPVDFDRRRQILQKVSAWDDLPPPEQRDRVAMWRHQWHDGAIKMHVLRRLLALRAAQPALFAHGSYTPIALPETPDDGLLAFKREHDGQRLIVAAILRAEDKTAAIKQLMPALQETAEGAEFADILSGAESLHRWPNADAQPFAQLPVAVWFAG